MSSLPCAWWHQPPKMTPLEAVRITADSLERGEVVPAAAAAIMARALRLYLAGRSDITGNLGLRPQRGRQTPQSVERRRARDEGIRRVFALQQGSKAERAKRVAVLLREPSEHTRVSDQELVAHLQALHREFGGDLPTSDRQVLRVVKGI